MKTCVVMALQPNIDVLENEKVYVCTNIQVEMDHQVPFFHHTHRHPLVVLCLGSMFFFVVCVFVSVCQYPHSLPSTRILNSRGMEDADIHHLETLLSARAKELLGTPMLYSLIEV